MQLRKLTYKGKLLLFMVRINKALFIGWLLIHIWSHTYF